jgi:hypothetical protein
MLHMTNWREIAVVWSWEDGTRCVLCSANGADNLVRAGRIVRRVPVDDILEALSSIAPNLEVECLDPKMTPERLGIRVD